MQEQITFVLGHHNWEKAVKGHKSRLGSLMVINGGYGPSNLELAVLQAYKRNISWFSVLHLGWAYLRVDSIQTKRPSKCVEMIKILLM